MPLIPGADPGWPVRHVVRHSVRPPQPARQGPVPGGGHAGRAVFLRLDVPAHQVVHQRLALGFGVGVQPAGLRPGKSRRPCPSTCSVPGDSGGHRTAGQKPGARRHWPRVDGHPRHGRRRRRDRHPPDVRQAQRVCRQLVHRRRGRCAVGLRLPGRLGAGGVLGGPVVPPAVHGDHRRHGFDHGQLLWRGLHRGAADLAEPVPAPARQPVRPGDFHGRASRTQN